MMTRFDKLCALLSIPIGIFFLILGLWGLFAGSNASFDLPPIVGVLPFFLGWTMCVTTIRFWRKSRQDSQHEITNLEMEPEGMAVPENDIPKGQFREFLERFPEFVSASRELQVSSFHKWRANAGLSPANKIE